MTRCENCIHFCVCKMKENIKYADTCNSYRDMFGKWIKWYPPKEFILTGEEMLYRCSVCDAKYSDIEGYRHCPHCGTRMEEGE